MAHTKAPWNVSPTGRFVRYGGLNGPNICDVGCFGGPKEEGAANLRLLAAAPDLLAACEEMVADLIAHAHFGMNESEVAMLKRAEAAIAKAGG